MYVHQECYGLSPQGAATFLAKGCQACRSIGTVVMGKTIKGAIKTATQEKRPRDCVLCCVKTGVHAMNPLYDKDGKKGRQVVLQNGNLAWVHTLCALSICSNRTTAGCVYGCDKWGNFYNDSADEAEELDEQNSKINNGGSGIDVTGVEDISTHHYVIITKENDEGKLHWNIIKDSREYLKCTDCTEVDKKSHFRIAIQCTAGDDDEYEDFRDMHREKDKCYAAMHVGCAMWGKGCDENLRRIYFFPGDNVEADGEPIMEVYCPRHARKIAAFKRRESQTTETQVPEKSSLSKANQIKKRGTVERQVSTSSLRRESSKEIKARNKYIGSKDSYVSATEATVTIPSMPMKGKRSSITISSASKDLPPPPSYTRHPSIGLESSKPRPRSNTASSGISKKDASKQAASSKVNVSGKTSSQKRKNSDNHTIHASLPDKEQSHQGSPKLPRVKRRYITESKISEDDEYDDDFDWVGSMVTDVMEALSMVKKYPKFFKDVLDSREYYWRRKSGIYGRDFNTIWGKVKEQINVPLNESSTRTPTGSGLTIDIDVDEETKGSQQTSRWDSLWKPDATLFSFGDWDSVELRSKQEEEETEEMEDGDMDTSNLML
eukprot:CAMPEP_0194225594 /NCGR_PEP_ID=MMETSP0156-20130528/39956_1 /TAXON_ID=33649 /ORGANISM="Thalassionema nitzschioides, Strain L26-B" /LENGTH=604 /DNA_ID=CAMNT_0038957605 /DNA_START=40 /DNA_END=1854 /DNA_ORIENTATION=+